MQSNTNITEPNVSMVILQNLPQELTTFHAALAKVTRAC